MLTPSAAPRRAGGGVRSLTGHGQSVGTALRTTAKPFSDLTGGVQVLPERVELTAIPGHDDRHPPGLSERDLGPPRVDRQRPAPAGLR
ncbi:hypothetical protein [Saccharopolyspora sp. NPDC050642]|uniref:hypothetical protein n=1 Tax=Saccharopolyspora sp. NPDC050642 TaxID=3157099 RepID=UPI0033F6A6C3